MKVFNYKNATLYLILTNILVKCILSQNLLLGNDEVYYISYAQHFQWNYFDHPPAVGFLIRLFTFNLSFNSDLLIRLGSIISFGFSTWFVFKTGETLSNPKAGFIAALIYCFNIYTSILSGLFILPDAPLMLFWTLALWVASSIAKAKIIQRKEQWLMLLFGLITGFALLSKAQSVYLWFGMCLYISCFDRKWLTKPVTYVSLIISSLIFSPAFHWQIINNDVSIEFHKNRILFDGSFHFDYLLKEITGEFFYTNPIIFILLIYLLIKFYKKNWSKERIVILLMSIPLLLTVWSISLLRETLPHWSGPGITGLIILMSSPFQLLSGNMQKKWMLSIFFFFSIILLLGVLFINSFPGTIYPNKIASKVGNNDFTLDMYGWDKLNGMLDSVLKTKDLAYISRKDLIIANDNWFPSAHLDHYVANPLKIDFIAIGKINDIHHYFWLNKHRTNLTKGKNLIFITSSNYFRPPGEKLESQFRKKLAPIYLPQYRSGKLCRYFILYPFLDFIAFNN